jgi:Major Facilitator Superfamily
VDSERDSVTRKRVRALGASTRVSTRSSRSAASASSRATGSSSSRASGSSGSAGSSSGSSTNGPGWSEFQEPLGSRFAFPTTPFSLLGLTHATAAAGDTLVAIALAKTLFFVSPNEARGKVLLYLLITLAPFAVVSPFVGPLIDRFASQRKHVLIVLLGVRSLVCLFLARDYDTPWLLFPETFALLVLSKGYSIARNSIIPSVVTRSTELVRANSKLSMLAGIAGALIAIPGGVLSLLGPGWVALLACIVFGASAWCASKLIVAETPFVGEPEPADLPEIERSSSSRSSSTSSRTSRENRRQSKHSFVTTLRLAGLVMSGQRAQIGLITFLVAFTMKRENAPTWWLGIAVTSGVLGGLLGSVIAPKLRGRVDEMTMLLGGVGFTAAVCLIAALRSSRLAAAIVAFVVSLSANVGRLAYDSIVQRFGDTAEQGSLFAKSETRFQLAWVLGALVPVALVVSRSIGFLLMSVISVLMIVVQYGGEHSLRHIDGTLAAGWSRWHRPARPAEGNWLSDEDL